jgi:hypothetical protein
LIPFAVVISAVFLTLSRPAAASSNVRAEKLAQVIAE